MERAEDGAVSQGSGGLDPEQFRIYGKQVIDWIADYLASAERYPVLSPLNPGDVKRQLPARPPQTPESMDAILADLPAAPSGAGGGTATTLGSASERRPVPAAKGTEVALGAGDPLVFTVQEHSIR